MVHTSGGTQQGSNPWRTCAGSTPPRLSLGDRQRHRTACHAFAEALSDLTWQSSDPDAELRESIALRIQEERRANVNWPIDLDVTKLPWPLQTADAVVAINLIHVAPWSATLALFEGAKALLSTQDVLFFYGPYRRFGRHTSQSNAQFDLDLRTHNLEWGLRDLEAVSDVATGTGFILAETVQMPANNFSLVFRKRGG